MKHTPKPTLEELLAESYEIADGKTIKIGTTAHVRALVAKLRAVEDLVKAAELILRGWERLIRADPKGWQRLKTFAGDEGVDFGQGRYDLEQALKAVKGE